MVPPRAPPEVRLSERSLTMKQAKEQPLEPLPGLWWGAQSKEEPTKHPSSKRHRPLRNSNSSRKRNHRPHINRVSTNLSEHSLHAWKLAHTPLNNNSVKSLINAAGSNG